ncbi:oxidoreductase [Halobacteriales archaeon SW_5_70_135]|nr:MAG: oxidoreductase [Halobacteriales archaeon SW_5_70_135]
MSARVACRSVERLGRSAGRLAAAVRIAARTALPVDTNPVPGEWTHVTKVDPEPEKRLPLSYPLYLRHTDAVSVGGSRDVTARNTELTFDLLAHAPTPVFHEPSAPAHVTDDTRERAAFVAIPEVLNGDIGALVGQLGAGIGHVRDELAPKMIDRHLPWAPERLRSGLREFAASWLLAAANFEAYIIQNPDSAAAREAGVGTADVLDATEAGRRAAAAERRLGSELLYVEYSGTYGGEEGADVVAAADDATHWSRVWYGGGIDSRDAALRMLEAGADAVVVGDAFHDVAEEEATLVERALGELPPDADHAAVRGWVAERSVDAAERFLSTVPAVADPERRARDYHAAAVHAGLETEAVARDLDDPSASDLREALRRTVPGEGALSAVGDRGRAYAYEVALAGLAARTGVDAGSLAVEHLAVDARPGAVRESEARR